MAVYSVGDILGKGILLIVAPLLTRALTPSQYGTIPLFMALWGVISVIQYAEITSSLTMFSAQTSEREVRDKIRVTATVIALISFSLVWTGFFIISIFTSFVIDFVGASKFEIFLFLIGIIPSSVSYWGAFVLRYQHQAFAFVRITMISRVFSIVCAMPFVFFFPEETRLRVYLSMVFLFNSISIFWMIWEFRKLGIQLIDSSLIDRSLGRRMLSFALRFVPSSILIASTVFADRLLIGYFMSNVDVGVLGLTLQLSAGVLMLKSWFSLVWDPHLVEWLATKEPLVYMPKLKNALSMVSVTFFCLTVLVSLWGREFVELIFPVPYHEVGGFIPIVVLNGSMSVLSLIAIATAIMENSPRFRIRISGIALTTNLAVGVVLIPKYGIIGALYGTFLSECAILISWIIIGKFVFKNLSLPWTVPLLGAGLTFCFINFYELGTLVSATIEQICFTVVTIMMMVIILKRNDFFKSKLFQK